MGYFIHIAPGNQSQYFAEFDRVAAPAFSAYQSRPWTNGEQTILERALEVLRQGPFCRYIIGSAISDTGTWMQVMAQAWVMSSLTNKAILLGMVNFAAGLPTLRSP